MKTMKMAIDAIAIKTGDNVATALRDIAANETIVVGCGEERFHISLMEPVRYGHKFAMRDIKEDENIIKYGEIIGRATKVIPAGAHAHVQNIESLRGRGDLDGENRGK